MRYFLEVPWEARYFAKQQGASYENGKYFYDGDHLPTYLSIFSPNPLSWTSWMQDSENNTVTRFSDDGTFKPRPYQAEASELIVKAFHSGYPSFLLGDKTGLGKTISGWDAIKKLPGGNALVLCPLSVVPSWRRTITLMGTADHRVCVENYDKWKRFFSVPKSAEKAKKAATKNKKIANEGDSLVDWDYIIFDESHKLANPDSLRTTASRGLRENAFEIHASATAGDHPLRFSYMNRLLCHLDGSEEVHPKDWHEWCQKQGFKVSKGRFGWEWDDNDADLEAINKFLFDSSPPAAIRRRPSDIEGWKEMRRDAYPIELSPEDMEKYQGLWTEFRRDMDLAQKGNDPTKGFAAQIRFRQKASLLRVPHVVQMIRDLVESGHQVPVSVAWIETAEAIQEALNSGRSKIESVMITGAITGDDREANRLKFQRDEAQVAIFTICEGISLHAGETAISGSDTDRILLIADPRWTGLETEQIEGRAHRDGSEAPTRHIFALDTIEHPVVKASIRKMRNQGKVMGDNIDPIEVIAKEIGVDPKYLSSAQKEG